MNVDGKARTEMSVSKFSMSVELVFEVCDLQVVKLSVSRLTVRSPVTLAI